MKQYHMFLRITQATCSRYGAVKNICNSSPQSPCLINTEGQLVTPNEKQRINLQEKVQLQTYHLYTNERFAEM